MAFDEVSIEPASYHDREMVEGRVREVVMRIETELAADVDRARKMLAENAYAVCRDEHRARATRSSRGRC